MFPDVTILFSDVVKFNEICIHITPMQVVDMLNEIYIVFDTLSEKHNVYKVTWPKPDKQYIDIEFLHKILLGFMKNVTQNINVTLYSEPCKIFFTF